MTVKLEYKHEEESYSLAEQTRNLLARLEIVFISLEQCFIVTNRLNPFSSFHFELFSNGQRKMLRKCLKLNSEGFRFVSGRGFWVMLKI